MNMNHTPHPHGSKPYYPSSFESGDMNRMPESMRGRQMNFNYPHDNANMSNRGMNMNGQVYPPPFHNGLQQQRPMNVMQSGPLRSSYPTSYVGQQQGQQQQQQQQSMNNPVFFNNRVPHSNRANNMMGSALRKPFIPHGNANNTRYNYQYQYGTNPRMNVNPSWKNHQRGNNMTNNNNSNMYSQPIAQTPYRDSNLEGTYLDKENISNYSQKDRSPAMHDHPSKAFQVETKLFQTHQNDIQAMHSSQNLQQMTYISASSSPENTPQEQEQQHHQQQQQQLPKEMFVSNIVSKDSQDSIQSQSFDPEEQDTSFISPQAPIPAPSKDDVDLDAASILCSLSRLPSPTTYSQVTNIDKASDLEPFTPITTNSNTTPTTATNTIKIPDRLCMPRDESELNSLHCFVRQELLEVFVTKEDPTTSSDLGGRLGLRCVFCAQARSNCRSSPLNNNTEYDYVDTSVNEDDECDDQDTSFENEGESPTNSNNHKNNSTSTFPYSASNTPMSVFTPKSLSHLYRLVCTWQRVHFHKCRHIPPSIRNKYHELKAADKSRGKVQYWKSSAMELGLKDDERLGGCVRYFPSLGGTK